jgi:hypothetical protein
MGEMNIDCLEYADDAALIDVIVEHATERISKFEGGALKDADMVISRPKTEVMHVCRQEAPVAVTNEDVEELIEEGVLKHKCEFCSAAFPTKAGLSMHVSRWCGEVDRGVYPEEYVIERILDVRGPPKRRFFKIKWKNYPLSTVENENWEPLRHLMGTAEDEMRIFWLSRPDLNNQANITQPNEIRCCFCNKFYKREQDLKTHLTKGCRCKPQCTAAGTRTAKAVRRRTKQRKQAERESVFAGDHQLKNVFEFVYLGHMFQADGEGEMAIERRTEKAKKVFGRLHEFWSSPVLPLKAKLQMYQCCVWSTLTYGHIAWKLTDDRCASLSQWNAKNLLRIKGKEVTGLTTREEMMNPTLDLVNSLKAQRLEWVGKVLTRGENFPARRILMKEQKPYGEGSILMNVPEHETMEELADIALDRPRWKREVNALKYGSIGEHSSPSTKSNDSK